MSLTALADRRHHLVLLTGTALVALHVADDTVLQPAAGTGAGDHLASGLVPLLLLALAGWAYPRVRPGAAAVVALSVGLAGLTGGVEAVHYARSVGPSGDDWTGFL